MKLSILMASVALAFAAASPAAADQWSDLAVTGPHVSGNLAVYFLHGKSAPGPVPLTLGEALSSGQAVVHETGEVQRLEIENTGTEPVFVQAGDIVKGGRQDRVLTVSLLIPPSSGRVAIGSYCVEQGRWSRRGNESAARFASAETRMPSLAAKRRLYARKSVPAEQTTAAPRNTARREQPQQQTVQTLRNVLGTVNRAQQRSEQSEIWASVAEVQRKLAANLDTSVKSRLSGSSLQLSLENQKLAEARDKLAAALADKGTAASDIVGYAFAINGRINSAEVYPSNGLFRKMWPKLLRASVTEAIAENEGEVAASPPPATRVTGFLKDAAAAAADRAKIAGGLLSERRETKGALANETLRADGTRVHLTILAH